MRFALLVVAASCAHAPHVSTRSYDGVVTDNFGRPIAHAEVLLCQDNGPCDFAVQRVQWARGTMRDEIEKDPDLARRARELVVTESDAHGHWRAETALPISHVRATASEWTVGVADLRGRRPNELTIPIEIELRRAATIEIVPHCNPEPCGRLSPTLLTHVQLGTRTVSVVSNADRAGEQRGTRTIDLVGPVAIDVDLQSTGTGRSIAGQLEVEGVGSLAERRSAAVHATISARCGDVERWIDIGTARTFVLEDVGPPPCRVSAHLATDWHEVSHVKDEFVNELPATVNLWARIGPEPVPATRISQP
jgi:hypothetical protein